MLTTEITENAGGVQPATKKRQALPLSLGSMAITGGLLDNVAGIVGYAVGKAYYFGACKENFQKLEPDFTKGSGQGWGPGFGPPFGGQRHRHCKHVCQECKKLEEPATASA